MKIRTLVHCGLLAALIAVTAWISIPFTVPFTMQTFGIFLTLLILGGKAGTASIAVYVLLGIVGLPVFAGFQGGIGVILSPLGGYILGFIAIGAVYFIITKYFGEGTYVKLTALAVGLMLCYLSGTLWYVMFGGETGFFTAASACVLPFIVPDGIKLWLAITVEAKIRQSRAIKNNKNGI